jgi:hypothetical protein
MDRHGKKQYLVTGSYDMNSVATSSSSFVDTTVKHHRTSIIYSCLMQYALHCMTCLEKATQVCQHHTTTVSYAGALPHQPAEHDAPTRSTHSLAPMYKPQPLVKTVPISLQAQACRT